MRRKRLAIPLIVAAAVVIGALLWLRGGDEARPGRPGGPGGFPPPLVRTAPAASRDLAITVRSVGSVEALQQITVTSPVTGTVRRLLFTEGRPVQVGELLVELDTARERAQLRAAEAERHEARRLLRRYTELEAGSAISEAQLDEARARLEAAEAAIAGARAAIAERRISAPFAGQPGLRQVSVGALIQPGDPITTLTTPDRLKLRFALPADLLPQLRPGLAVRARAPGIERVLEGRVTRLDNTVNPATRTLALEAELADSRALRPGMFVNVELVLSVREDAVVVPEESVLLEGERSYVYIVGPEGRARRLTVRLGERRPGTVEVLEGLAAGVEVITAGVQKVQDGMPVQLSDAAGMPQGAGPPR